VTRPTSFSWTFTGWPCTQNGIEANKQIITTNSIFLTDISFILIQAILLRQKMHIKQKDEHNADATMML
jgi:hypothetical protein